MKKLLLFVMITIGLAINSPATFAHTHFISVHTEHKKDITVYVTRTGAKYHSEGCSYLRRSSIPMKRKAAIAAGYTACSRCW